MDIAERLRAAARHPYMDNTCKVRTYDALEAADEIEKLRAALNTANEQLVRTDLKITSLRAELAAERERCVMQCEAVSNRINTPHYERSEWDDGYVCGAMAAAAALKETGDE